MEDLEFSSSDGGRRYSQYSTSFDSADWRSNSMNESTGLNAGWLGSCSSYVRVEHSDAEITGGSSRAVDSWCSAEHPELQADLADQNLQQQSPSYPNRQNSLHTNQFDYMHLSTLAYDPQSEADHQSNTDDRKEYWARRSEPDYFAHPPPIPTPDAEYSNDFHLLYSVPDVLNDQGQALPNSGIPYYTQPVYPEEDLRGDIRLHYAGHTRESNNGACSHQHLVAEDVNGPWSTVNPQNNCPRHLEQQMNRILDVINASDSSPSTRDGSNEQQWGEASDVTVRPDNAQQSHQSGHSNASRHPLPTQHQAGLLISRDLAIIPNGPRSLPIRTRSPSMRSIDNNRRPPIPASNTPASPSSAQSNVVRCPVCSAQFEGIYAQGNCGRHRRLKHAVQKKEYPCEHSTCGKSYQRSDARLKHYRKYHPELIGCAV